MKNEISPQQQLSYNIIAYNNGAYECEQAKPGLCANRQLTKADAVLFCFSLLSYTILLYTFLLF